MVAGIVCLGRRKQEGGCFLTAEIYGAQRSEGLVRLRRLRFWDTTWAYICIDTFFWRQLSFNKGPLLFLTSALLRFFVLLAIPDGKHQRASFRPSPLSWYGGTLLAVLNRFLELVVSWYPCAG